MAINKKLITFDKKAAFLGANGINGSTSPTDGYFGQIPAWSMVFIKDTGEIWHLGVYFGKPISSLISSGGSYANGFVYTPDGTNYYYKTVTLWGNTLNGSTVNLKDKLVTEETVGGTTYRLAYGGRGIERRIMSGSTPVDTYLMMFGENLVTIDAVTKVRGGLLTVSSSNSYTASINSGIQTAGAIKADLYLYDTNTYISTNYSLGKAWNSIKLFNVNGTQIDLSQTKPAIITIQESNHAVNSDWQPWISGGDMTSYSSWGIGLGGDAFYIGRISKDETTNLLNLYWKFDATNGITLSGTTKYILVDGVQDGNNKVFMADGTLKSLSEAMGVSIGEATINDLGGFKLSTAKAATTLIMSSSTTGAGKYPIKMNADSTLYVEITQANTWKAANNSQEGYVPLLSNGGTALADSTNDYILAFTYASSGTLTPSWKKLPTTAYSNTTYKLKINNSTNGDSTNGVNLGTIYAPETAGTGFLKGTAGENGAITWSWDNSTYNNYSLPTASDLLKGGVKTGAAIDSISGYTAVHIKDEVIYYKDTNTWNPANTSLAGYIPKLETGGGTIISSDTAYVLAYKSGVQNTTTPVWILLPTNAYKNDNTWNAFTAATASDAGVAGYIQAPAGAQNKFFRGDNTWQDVLMLSGGTMVGNITFSGDNSIIWSRNTDSASISFKNSSNADADSYMHFLTSDDFNEYFRFTHKDYDGGVTEYFSIKSDGARVLGTKVSLEGHTHNYIISSGFIGLGTTSLSTWGTLTTTNGYTGILNINETGGGSWEIAAKDGLISMLIDGCFYQNEGAYMVLDKSMWITPGNRNDTPSKIVTTDTNGYIQAGWINTTSGTYSTSSYTTDKVYCSFDNYIRYLSISDFASLIASLNGMGLKTFTKTISCTLDTWSDTGIQSNDLSTGTYAVLVFISNSSINLWTCYWSGIMSWYEGGTNDNDAHEIILHSASHANNTLDIYLRTLRTPNSIGALKLLIASDVAFTNCEVTFKFRKLI